MSREPSAVDESPAVGCFSECPHFADTAGTCNHEFSQTLIRQFIDSPGATCPVYSEWRAERMAALARQLERDGSDEARF